MNPYPHSLDNKRYQTWNYYLKKRFGKKVYKVPLSLGTTCPNRDGTKGLGGCSFCLGGGGGALVNPGEFPQQFAAASAPLEAKWPNSLAIPYFQSYSNTYLPVEQLAAALEAAHALPNTVGIALATRPDCLPLPVLDLLEEWSKKTFLMVELGLQSAHDRTAQRIGRGHSYSEFLAGYQSLTDRGIPVCIHLLNGLPGESPQQMRETAQMVALLRPHSVKIHMLHLLEGTSLGTQYQTDPFPFMTREDYVTLICDQLERLPPETVIQRITGDPPNTGLIAPLWTTNKLWIRNAIDKELAARNSWQGAAFPQK